MANSASLVKPEVALPSMARSRPLFPLESHNKINFMVRPLQKAQNGFLQQVHPQINPTAPQKTFNLLQIKMLRCCYHLI